MLEQLRDVGERERNVLDLTRLAQGADIVQGANVAPDVEHAMPVVRVGRIARAHPVGEEMHEHDPGPCQLLQRLHQNSRCGAGAADEHLVARTHDRDRLCGRNLTIPPIDFRADAHAGAPRLAPRQAAGFSPQPGNFDR